MSSPPASPPPVLVVGDVMLDRYLHGAAERISPEAPVPVLHVRRTSLRPGGAANVAVNVAALGGQPRLVGVVGHDAAAEQLRRNLAEEGVAGDDLLATDAVPTTTKTRLLAGHHQVARFDEEQALVDLPAREEVVRRARTLVRGVGVAVISDYAKGVCDTVVCRAVIEEGSRAGVTVVVDPKDADFTKYSGAAVITPNRGEAAAVVQFPIRDHDDAIRAARKIADRFAIGAVIVTLGEQGMVVLAGGEVSLIPTQARRVFDVTGAGDTAVAMLAVALAEGSDLPQACFLANAAAGLQVGRIGTARISRGEVAEAIERGESAARGKVVDLESLRLLVRRARAEGKRIGFTNGCFDILHHGHVTLLDAAARECDALVVGVNSDASVRRLKGSPRPFVPAGERQAVLAGLASVAWVCEFDADTPLDLIRAVEPDVLVKGADYTLDRVVGADIVLARGGRVVTPLFVPNASTTSIVDRIRAAEEPPA